MFVTFYVLIRIFKKKVKKFAISQISFTFAFVIHTYLKKFMLHIAIYVGACGLGIDVIPFFISNN